MVSSSASLGEALIWIACGTLVVAVIAVLVIWRARATGRSGTLAIDTAYTLATAFVFFSGLGVAFIVFRFFFAPDPSFVIPLAATWPTPLPCTTTGGELDSGLYCASFTSAQTQIMGAAFWPRAAVAGAQILSVLTAVVPAIAVATITGPKHRDLPFQRATVRVLTWGAVVLLLAGTLSEILGQIGTTLIAQAALNGSTLAPQSFSLSLQIWPAGAAIAMLALAAVFRHGMRLQEDKIRLQRETEGLV